VPSSRSRMVLWGRSQMVYHTLIWVRPPNGVSCPSCLPKVILSRIIELITCRTRVLWAPYSTHKSMDGSSSPARGARRASQDLAQVNFLANRCLSMKLSAKAADPLLLSLICRPPSCSFQGKDEEIVIRVVPTAVDYTSIASQSCRGSTPGRATVPITVHVTTKRVGSAETGRPTLERSLCKLSLYYAWEGWYLSFRLHTRRFSDFSIKNYHWA